MSESDAELERISDLLFGRPLVLHVARWIIRRRGKAFFQSELTGDLPLRFGSNCIDVLSDMVELKMLKRLPKGTIPGRNRVYYQALPSRLWDCFRIAVSAATDNGGHGGRRVAGRADRGRRAVVG